MEITKSELRQILKTNTHNKTNLFKGVVLGKCGVECFVNDDCSEDILKEKFCDGVTQKQKVENYFCNDATNKCLMTENENVLGVSLGVCGVECLTDDDCKERNGFVGENYCKDNNVVSCEKNVCANNLDFRVVNDCSDICVDATCMNRTFIEKIKDFFQKYINEV